MRRTVKRAFKFRFYPSPDQANELIRTFGCVRFVYNDALAFRTSEYRVNGKSVKYTETSDRLTRLKKEHTFLAEVSSVPLQQSLRHLQAAYSNFFAKRAKYPKFKSKHKSRQAAEYTRSAFTYRDGKLKLAKMADPLDIRWSRDIPSEPSAVTVSRDPAGRWFVSLLCEQTILPLPVTDQVVGIDAGLTSLVTLSTGEKIVNPKHERPDRQRLARAQRALSRKQKGSANRARARVKVARAYARITDRRTDFLHKLSTRLVRENQVVVIEDLAVGNMVRNHSLARAISDASWGELRRMLEYKAGWHGREVVVVSRWFPSSKMCGTCGAIRDSLPLNVRDWTCDCGATHDRDVNAAQNILAAGLVV